MIRLLFRAVALGFAATLLATAVQAQQPPATAPRPATPAAPAESHLALARDLANMTGVTTLFDGLLGQLGAQIRQSFMTRPELSKDLDQVIGTLKPELDQQKQTMIDLTARYYASSFSEAELKELVTQFRTPLGQKYLRTAPQILDAISFETERWTARVSEFFVTRLRAEMAKRGHQL
jgi:uncharacterized protein